MELKEIEDAIVNLEQRIDMLLNEKQRLMFKHQRIMNEAEGD